MTGSAAPAAAAASGPAFDEGFRQALGELIAWRRDVRRFRAEPVDPALLEALLDLACLAPSVGNSQPWRFVTVDAAARRARVLEIFRACSDAALSGYGGARAELYARLKLSGLAEAPLHLAVFADTATAAGDGLGRQTMPETLRYSAVLAVHTFWLAARAHGLGVGWVSILDPAAVAQTLETPADWTLVAYLCVGYPVEEHLDPELERHGWQPREAACRKVLER